MPDPDDLAATTVRTAALLAFYGSGWLVTHPVLPESLQPLLTALLSFLGAGAVVVVLYLAYGELSPGQCRALTTDGDRCSRTAGLGADCCWQHQRLHGVELVEDR